MLPHRYRWMLLLTASCIFYMAWRPSYIVLVFISSFIDYCAALLIWRSPSASAQLRYLIVSLSCNLGILFAFKYFRFFNDTMAALVAPMGFEWSPPAWDVLLPVGISFYTFQSMSYTLDMYLHGQKPERHAGLFALYVMFFPQLVAGPIERSGNLLPQFRTEKTFDVDRAASGLRLMLWGMFKKVVIADRLALVVDQVYNHLGSQSGPALTIATVCFAFQIYCDFSGYSDIAIGAARVLGFDLMRNFNRPYIARSIGEFWSRWHISLSTWFKDYVYIPLGGNRVPIGRWRFNIFLVFMLSGLWHGANWTFVIWGALHGGAYVISSLTTKLRASFVQYSGLARMPRLHRALQTSFIFFVVCVAWVFFRARSVEDALYVLRHSIAGWEQCFSTSGLNALANALQVSPLGALLTAASVAILLAVEHSMDHPQRKHLLAKTPRWIRWPAYAGLALGAMNLGVMKETPFVYFQF